MKPSDLCCGRAGKLKVIYFLSRSLSLFLSLSISLSSTYQNDFIWIWHHMYVVLVGHLSFPLLPYECLLLDSVLLLIEQSQLHLITKHALNE